MLCPTFTFYTRKISITLLAPNIGEIDPWLPHHVHASVFNIAMCYGSNYIDLFWNQHKYFEDEIKLQNACVNWIWQPDFNRKLELLLTGVKFFRIATKIPIIKLE